MTLKDIYKIVRKQEDKEVIPAESELVVAGIYEEDYLNRADQVISDWLL